MIEWKWMKRPMKKNVILSLNENVLLIIDTEQMQNSEKLLGIKNNS